MSLNVGSEIALQPGQRHTMPMGEARDLFRRNSNWWVVYAAFDLPDFVPSPTWISQRTNLDVAEVVEALEGLTTLGCLTKDDGAFYPVKGKEFIGADWPTESKAKVIDGHALVSQQILNQLHEKTQIAYDHRCIAANKKIISELYQDISKAFEKAFENARSNPSANDGIYKMTFTAVDVAPLVGSPTQEGDK